MNPVTYTRTVKSYVIRAGRITPRQKHAFEQHWDTYGLSVADGLLNLEMTYQRVAPTILEIGFGMGHSLIEMAKTNPHHNYLGVEVHPPGVGATLANASELGLQNLRIYAEDAHLVLAQCIPNESLDRVLVFFPDPWPKKKHHKRRLIQTQFLKLVWQKLKFNGNIHIATDISEYAEHVLHVFKHFPEFNNYYGIDQFAPVRPETRPLTKFELRGTKLGHTIRDMIFIK